MDASGARSFPPAAVLQVFTEMGLCRPRVGPPQPRGHGPAPGAGAKGLGMVLSACLKSASSLTPWREDEEERVRKLSSDGVDESCFLSTR